MYPIQPSHCNVPKCLLALYREGHSWWQRGVWYSKKHVVSPVRYIIIELPKGLFRRWCLYLASPCRTTIEIRMYHALPMNTSSILSLYLRTPVDPQCFWRRNWGCYFWYCIVSKCAERQNSFLPILIHWWWDGKINTTFTLVLFWLFVDCQQ